MKTNIRLFIQNREIEFNKEPDILFNYIETDLTNPLNYKNSFSKEITIEGTKTNNDIFGHFWQLDRIQEYSTSSTSIYFNPTKKVPFTIYVNEILYKNGYIKLNNIKKENNKIYYNITLFGILGGFLNNLAINYQTGEEKKLSDLYLYDSNDNEINDIIQINNDYFENIQENSEYLKFLYTNSNIQDGVLDKNKIAFYGYPYGVQQVDNFTTVGGYSLVNSENELKEINLKIFTNYLFIPAIRTKTIIDSICKPINSKSEYEEGYEVELDEDFFNENNPYYADTYMTLDSFVGTPSTVNENVSGETHVTYYDGTSSIYTRENSDKNIRYVNVGKIFNIDNLNSKNSISYLKSITGNVVTFEMLLIEHSPIGNDIALRLEETNDLKKWGCILLTLYSNRDNKYKHVLLSNNSYVTYNFLNEKLGTQLINMNDIICPQKTYMMKYDEYSTYGSHYLYKLTIKVDFGNDLEKYLNALDINSNSLYVTADLKFFSQDKGTNIDEVITIRPDNRRQVLNFYKTRQDKNLLRVNYDVSKTIVDKVSNAYYLKDLMRTQYNPTDWLISYCKLFGLYILVDDRSKKVKILTRNNFFKIEDIINIQEQIDFDSITVIPSSIEERFISLSIPHYETEYSKKYKEKYGVDYGIKLIDTGSEFNSKIKELNSNTVFKNCIMVNEPNNYNYIIKDYEYNTYKPYLNNGGKVTLYKNGKINNDTKEIELNKYNNEYLFNIDKLRYSNVEYPFYDVNFYPYLDKDFSNILLFNNNNNNNFSEYRLKDSIFRTFFENDYISNEYSKLMSNYNFSKYKTTISKVIKYSKTTYYFTFGENSDSLLGVTRVGVVPVNVPGTTCEVDLYYDDDDTCRVYYNNGSSYTFVDLTGITEENIVTELKRLYDLDIENNKLELSLDFGTQRETYLPGFKMNEEKNLYTYFYKRYLNDLYDVNTKVVECYIKPNKLLNEEDFRNIYWFDNCYWRLNKIYDYNPNTLEKVKVQFIKVNDLDSLSNNVPGVIFEVILETEEISDVGGIIMGEVKSSVEWELIDNNGLTITPISGVSDTQITITIPKNEEDFDKSYILRFKNKYKTIIEKQIIQKAKEEYLRFTDTSATTKTILAEANDHYINIPIETTFTSFTTGATGSITNVNVTSSGNWIYIYFPRNENPDIREVGSATVSAGNYSLTVYVRQKGTAPQPIGTTEVLITPNTFVNISSRDIKQMKCTIYYQQNPSSESIIYESNFNKLEGSLEVGDMTQYPEDGGVNWGSSYTDVQMINTTVGQTSCNFRIAITEVYTQNGVQLNDYETTISCPILNNQVVLVVPEIGYRNN